MTHKHCPVYLWKCTVCGDEYYGKNPPFACKDCNSEANRYVLVSSQDSVISALNIQSRLRAPSLNTVLYLVGSVQDGRVNAMCCGSVTQVTYCPDRVAVAVNKNNLTHDYIKVSGVLSLSLLGQNHLQMAHHFGRKSGRQINKFDLYSYRTGKTGSPIIEESPGYFECRVDHRSTMDLDSHTLFVAEIMEAVIDSQEPSLTYWDYIKHLSKN